MKFLSFNFSFYDWKICMKLIWNFCMYIQCVWNKFSCMKFVWNVYENSMYEIFIHFSCMKICSKRIVCTYKNFIHFFFKFHTLFSWLGSWGKNVPRSVKALANMPLTGRKPVPHFGHLSIPLTDRKKRCNKIKKFQFLID